MVSRIGWNEAANFVDRAWNEIVSVNTDKANCNWKGESVLLILLMLLMSRCF
jgi:hypothetical protein